jgi:hypothetical protein
MINWERIALWCVVGFIVGYFIVGPAISQPAPLKFTDQEVNRSLKGDFTGVTVPSEKQVTSHKPKNVWKAPRDWEVSVNNGKCRLYRYGYGISVTEDRLTFGTSVNWKGSTPGITFEFWRDDDRLFNKIFGQLDERGFPYFKMSGPRSLYFQNLSKLTVHQTNGNVQFFDEIPLDGSAKAWEMFQKCLDSRLR